MQNSDEQEPNETVSTMIGMTQIHSSSLLGLSSCPFLDSVGELC